MQGANLFSNTITMLAGCGKCHRRQWIGNCEGVSKNESVVGVVRYDEGLLLLGPRRHIMPRDRTGIDDLTTSLISPLFRRPEPVLFAIRRRLLRLNALDSRFAYAFHESIRKVNIGRGVERCLHATGW